MVKDRLKEFQALAGTNKNGKAFGIDSTDMFHPSSRLDDTDERTKFLRTDNWSDVELFLNRIETTRQLLDEMRECLMKMKKIHSEILLLPGSHAEFTEQLSETVDKFKRLARRVSERSKELKDEATLSSSDNDVNSRIKTIQADELTRRLHETLFEFHNEQYIYRDKCKNKINLYLSIAGFQLPEEEVDDAIEKGQIFNTVGIVMADRDKKLLIEEVRERHKEIIELEHSITELNDMMQDLAMLITSQGCLVDRIETNVMNTVEHTNKALYSVNYAKESKRRNMKLKICLLICILISIVVLFCVSGAAICFYMPFLCRS